MGLDRDKPEGPILCSYTESTKDGMVWLFRILQAGDIDPDLFFMDKPREYRMSPSNREYISFWADEVPGAVCGRSPIECYTDFMRSFHSAFANDIGEAIEEIVVGCGPCGELRLVFVRCSRRSSFI